MGSQHRGLINHVRAKRFINPGGPPVFKLHVLLAGGLINTAGFVNPNLILVSTQVPWRVDVGFMEVSCRFHRFLCLNMVVAWRLLTDAVFMGVPCRFRGGLM